ncbi:MAG TPA: isocitrate/isopropylmalate family dehydrogenase [Methanotrichaceae archaeon]|nr:MAG: Homoisocitrate dehydrogenase [Methanosaeta sp. PtaU1.Bin028]HOT06380.1 isocitrate/isopropylmalate family dehydrogenase [Methanotrichaceae archaeon]HQF16151.1 isocitrate/isopropylmalate family dehydrogenase [Methanotrichaceae archaeon]HQI90887.1 isocitrate/isopropylmalate family dehydrogenase [Methanotrichaceae archaeon]HQJ28309.1 isocitrate/isopropylmalate family dehydrogenase [Methanotrichaceae archaeon]
MRRVAVVGGDGIGPEVIRSALLVLDSVGFAADMVPLDVGFARWRRTGTALAQEDLETMRRCDCILFGAITTPPDPAYRSVLLRIRKDLDLYANIRPFHSSRIDLVIVRENTEGLYSGIEEIGQEEARTVRVITRAGSRRIAAAACQLASRRRRLTIVHKSNVLKSDTLFLETCREEARAAGVSHDDMLVDAAAYNLVLRPERFDVMVTTNLFGDILSDEMAGVLGSLGLCSSANLGERHALFEPIHGSAPDIAGRGVANPVGAVRSAAMMLEWFGLSEESRLVEAAVQSCLAKGMVTPDLGGSCTTEQATACICQAISRGLP